MALTAELLSTLLLHDDTNSARAAAIAVAVKTLGRRRLGVPLTLSSCMSANLTVHGFGRFDTYLAHLPVASARQLDELTSDRPAWTDRFSGKQLAGNAPVVGGVPLDARVAEGDQLRHDTQYGPASINQ